MYDKLLWQHKRHERGSISKRQTTLKKGLFEGSVPYAWSQTLRIVWCCCTNMASKRKKQTRCLTKHSFAVLTKAVIQQMRNRSYAWSTCVFSLCNARLSLFAMKWSYLNPVRPCRSKRIDQLLHCDTIPRHKTASWPYSPFSRQSYFPGLSSSHGTFPRERRNEISCRCDLEKVSQTCPTYFDELRAEIAIVPLRAFSQLIYGGVKLSVPRSKNSSAGTLVLMKRAWFIS